MPLDAQNLTQTTGPRHYKDVVGCVIKGVGVGGCEFVRLCVDD